MESNGKSVNIDFQNTLSPCANIFGFVGTDAQHSFFQSLHQSTLNTSIDLIAFKKIYDDFDFIDKKNDNLAFNLLLKSCLADVHKNIKGGKNANLLLFDKLNEFSLGSILCLYEYKTIIEAAFSKTNPFDQFGVELGKEILNKSII